MGTAAVGPSAPAAKHWAAWGRRKPRQTGQRQGLRKALVPFVLLVPR